MNVQCFRLDGTDDSQVWVSQDGRMPCLLHWGPPLPAEEDLDALARVLAAPIPQGGLDVAEERSWLPEPGRGFTDFPGLELRRGDRRLYTAFVLQQAIRLSDGWRFDLTDAACGLALSLTLALDTECGVFSARSTLANTGGDALAIDALATICLPLPDGAEERWSIGGAWSAEFRAVREPIGHATWLQEARTGRSSHHAFPGLTLLQRGTNATQGSAWSAQIEWSGNHRIALQRTRLGGGQWQLGELLLPGEVVLAPAAVHTTPLVHLRRSACGLRELSAGWHRFIRSRVLPPQPADRARRVQFNTWEATYFDHDPVRLRALADAAAAVGVERFVLDDGWFGGRRNDRAGLGDWWPAPTLYPQGLAPLAQHCRSLGMQFGLWVEPEGVNADSDLYRANPDWVLHVAGHEQPLGRHQYVLDLGRAAVREHLFAQLSALLRGAPIDFLKWDMNRDFTHEAGADGRAGARAHVLGLHELLARLRAAFPLLEIETCASGGGRADLGMLRHCRRVWVSDCNDPLERQHMQSTFLHFLPPEVMGAHVGPRESHTTGRESGIALRTLSALFGHFGIEADVSAMSDGERRLLREAIEVYQGARAWLGDATVTTINSGDETIVATLAVSADHTHAWLTVVATDRSRQALPSVLRLPGLAAGRMYEVHVHPLWTAPARGLKHGGLLDRVQTVSLLGDTLRTAGLRLPALWPGTGCLVVLRARGHRSATIQGPRSSPMPS
jgi:alpha-galactosidase